MASIDSGFATPPRRPQLRIDVPKSEIFCDPPSFMLSPATPNGTPLSADKAELRRRLLIKRSPSSSAPPSPFVSNGDQPFAPCFTTSYLSPIKPLTPRESQYTTSPPGSPIGEATSLLNGTDTPFDFIKSDFEHDSCEKESKPAAVSEESVGAGSEEVDNDAASVLMHLWHSSPMPIGSPAIHSSSPNHYRSLSSLSSPMSPIAAASSSSFKRSASFDHFDDEADFVSQLKHGNKKDNRIPNSCESHKRRHLRCPIDCPERKRRETSSTRRSSSSNSSNHHHHHFNTTYSNNSHHHSNVALVAAADYYEQLEYSLSSSSHAY